jgi:Caspase domain
MTTNQDGFAGSRAVLVGVSEYAEFPVIRAAHNSLLAMRDLLSDPALCGWPPGRITIIPDPDSAAGLAAQVADLAEDTTGVFLLYYVGHGVLSARGELCLTVTSTRPTRPKITGLAWADVADVLRTCPARVRLVILDCCFAGQAIEALAVTGSPGVADISHVQGVYTLTATTRNHTAHVPPPDQQHLACTSFTGELRDLIRAGIPGKPPRLTLGDIYPVLRARLLARGLPPPNQRGIDTADKYLFTANPAVSTGPPGHVRSGGPGTGQASRTSPATARTDQPRARRVLGDAIQIGHTITDETLQGQALTHIARVLAPVDLDRAEHFAQSITDEPERASALESVARALATTDPDRAERLARSITDEDYRDTAFLSVARALATTDPDRAERLAQSISSELKAFGLCAVAEAVAAADPDRAARLAADAEYVAQSITDEAERASALESVAKALAITDPDRAERLAQSITSPHAKALALAAIADIWIHGSDRMIAPSVTVVTFP